MDIAGEAPQPGPLTGRCLCGGVRFRLEGPIPAATTCHCSQCRRQTSYLWVSVEVLPAQMTLTETRGLAWHVSSPGVRRGFCRDCGGFLFWSDDAGTVVGVSVGAIDPPTGLRIARHTWVAHRGDYYDIADGLPQEDEETL